MDPIDEQFFHAISSEKHIDTRVPLLVKHYGIARLNAARDHRGLGILQHVILDEMGDTERSHRLDVLLEAGLNPNVCDSGPDVAPVVMPPIIMAASKADMDGGVTIRQLLEHGADIHASESDGATVMHQAAQRGHPAALQMMLDYGASLDAVDHHGNTPLALAVDVAGNMENTVFLLEQGADPARAMQGRAWDFAVNSCRWSGDVRERVNLVRAAAVEQERQTLRQTAAEVEQAPEVVEQPAPRRQRARL